MCLELWVKCQPRCQDFKRPKPANPTRILCGLQPNLFCFSQFLSILMIYDHVVNTCSFMPPVILHFRKCSCVCNLFLPHTCNTTKFNWLNTHGFFNVEGILMGLRWRRLKLVLLFFVMHRNRFYLRIFL